MRRRSRMKRFRAYGISWWLGYHLRPVPWRSVWWCARHQHFGHVGHHCPRCGEILR